MGWQRAGALLEHCCQVPQNWGASSVQASQQLYQGLPNGIIPHERTPTWGHRQHHPHALGTPPPHPTQDPTSRGCALGQTRIPHLMPGGDVGTCEEDEGWSWGLGRSTHGCWESRDAVGTFSTHPFPVGPGTGTPVPQLSMASVLPPIAPTAPIAHPKSSPSPPLCVPLPPPPPRHPWRVRAPLRSRWLCLAARCRSRRASRPGCAGPNRMTRFGAPRLLPAPRRRQQIRSDGSPFLARHGGRRQCQQLPKKYHQPLAGPELGSVSGSSGGARGHAGTGPWGGGCHLRRG